MATVTETTVECDAAECRERGKSIQHFTITYPGERVQMDLCPKHAKPLMNLRKLVKSAPPRTRGVHPIPRSEIPRKG